MNRREPASEMGARRQESASGASSADAVAAPRNHSRNERPSECLAFRLRAPSSSPSCSSSGKKRLLPSAWVATRGRRLLTRPFLQLCLLVLIVSILSQQFFLIPGLSADSRSSDSPADGATTPVHGDSQPTSKKEARQKVVSRADSSIALQSPSSTIASRIAGRKETLQRLIEFDMFRDDDVEDVRSLLLRTDEYPVKYSSSTMQYFLRRPLFKQLSVVAREKQPAGPGQRRKIIGVAGTSLDDQGMANIMMLAIDSNYRRMGLGRELLRQSLELASLFARGSKRNPNPRYQIDRARLHVWVTQAPPLSLYLSTGFTPVEYIPNYYSSQNVQAGYDLQLSLPYRTVEERLRTAVAKQEKLIAALESKVEQLSFGPPGSGAAKIAKALPPVVVTPMREASSDEEQKVIAFLVAQNDKQLLQSAQAAFGNATLRNFAALASSPTGNVVGALWLKNPVKDGVLSGIETIVDEDADPDAVLYLFEYLLLEAGKAEHGAIEKVINRIPAEDLAALIHHWESGFRVTNFFEVTGKEEEQWGDASGFDGLFEWRKDRRFEHEMTVSIPWTKPEEFALTQRVKLNKSRIILLSDAVKELQKNPPQTASTVGADPSASASSVKRTSVPPVELPAKTAEGPEPHKLFSETPGADPTEAVHAASPSGELVGESASSASAQGSEKTGGPGERRPEREALESGETAAAGKAKRKNGEQERPQGTGPSESQVGAKRQEEDGEGEFPFLQNCTALLLVATGFLLLILCWRRCWLKGGPIDNPASLHAAAGSEATACSRARRAEPGSPGSFSGMRPQAKKEGYAPVVLPLGIHEQFDDEA
ncbi:acetyltransferase, GNAT family protein [Toxoplasma gondii GAB2-2007-GAL-DOM2]|uniref:Acetyltransferase domain-containing protein n=5 Tax=Toxoplasma gondii TaxID=5811 RepID=V4Z8W7_TOXGV|nr:acetyltransferase, GNAT family protein [Toxoplasma gondii VEG]KFG38307.1 acetyltransferase, GNAT family protein [Toxoplasma gondii p89]KFG47681.1 acetyltransferase, GNAT family protein [Toxoplasma gondii GAB2-2007-GAL-DOM2]KFG50935.1 acetyltransferase, GNAT family protein [Toxoplasma gondii FOU]PUA88810.1 acetyltransferase, GNAT family protein [Toxoplasma gondii TgCATBr9]